MRTFSFVFAFVFVTELQASNDRSHLMSNALAPIDSTHAMLLTVHRHAVRQGPQEILAMLALALNRFLVARPVAPTRKRISPSQRKRSLVSLGTPGPTGFSEDFPGGPVLFRNGKPMDTLPIAGQLLAMKMNPLSIDHTRFIVCESADGKRIGFGQIRKLSDDMVESETLWELASIYVDEQWRGDGLGSSIVRRLLKRHEQQGNAFSNTYLLTLEPTSSWYERFGFQSVAKTDIPSQMAFEVKAGEWLSAVLGNRLLCMRGSSRAQILE